MTETTTTQTVTATETRKGKRRPVIAFALAVLAVGGIGAAATSAAWTDNTFFSAQAEAATFNLQGSLAGGTLVESDNKNSIQIVVPADKLANLLPGQTRTIDLTIANLGSVGATLTSSVEFATSSTFTTNPTATVTGLASTLTAASGATATDQFQLVVTAPSDWAAVNQGKSATIIVTVSGTATA